MRKLTSIILTFFLGFSLLSGCGMPGPLYQETKQAPATTKDSQDKVADNNEQQE